MSTKQRSILNLYRDSVSLMQFSDRVAALPGVARASAVMATENNLSLLVEASLIGQGAPASPNDLLIVVEGEDEAALAAALDEAEGMIRQKPPASDGEAGRTPPHSITMGLDVMPGANLALISTPGEYAAAEALKALRQGLHVMIFTSNVEIEDEIALKRYSTDHNLLVMGPDCGTAIVNGIPLGFANAVRRGVIGVVGASGTGLQQVTSLIHQRGGGISQAIGTGSHDLHSKVGGASMRQGIAALAADPNTQVIVLVSKPPAPEVAEKVLEQAAHSRKPVVVDFIGAEADGPAEDSLYRARTLDDAAAAAVALAEGKIPAAGRGYLPPDLAGLADQLALSLKPGQRYLRGLFSGGTFCYETLLLLDEPLGGVFSNTPLRPELRLADVWHSQGHTAIDLGDDYFVQGRPHPMIDFRLRIERLLKEAADPETALIVLDVVLGYGSHPDPAAELAPAIQQARQIAEADGRELAVIGMVCGTDADPQNLARQETALREAGAHLVESNAQAARLAAAVLGDAAKRK